MLHPAVYYYIESRVTVLVGDLTEINAGQTFNGSLINSARL